MTYVPKNRAVLTNEGRKGSLHVIVDVEYKTMYENLWDDIGQGSETRPKRVLNLHMEKRVQMSKSAKRS